MQSAARALLRDARRLGLEIASGTLRAPPEGWTLDYAGGVEREVVVDGWTVRVTVGDDADDAGAGATPYLTLSRLFCGELVDGLTAQLSPDARVITACFSWVDAVVVPACTWTRFEARATSLVFPSRPPAGVSALDAVAMVAAAAVRAAACRGDDGSDVSVDTRSHPYARPPPICADSAGAIF